MSIKKYMSIIKKDKSKKEFPEKDFKIKKLELENQNIVAMKSQKEQECEELRNIISVKDTQIENLRKTLSKYYNLYDTSAIINSIYDLNNLLKYIVEAFLSIVEIDFCSVALFDVKGRNLIVENTNIYNEEYLEELNKNVNNDILFDAIESGGIYVNNNLNFNDLKFVSNPEIKSFCCVPINTINKKYGAILLESRSINKFDKETRKLANSMGDMFAQSLENIQLYKKISELATLDGLTGIYNRRSFQEKLSKEMSLAIENESPLSLIIFDIDHFKRINDTYSHQVGDKVLKEVVNIAKGKLQKAYTLSRYGGEEFVIIMPNTYGRDAVKLAESIRSAIEEHEIPDRRKVIKVTVSFGVASYPVNASSESNLIKLADRALYKAKDGGRNCVMVSDEKL